MKVELIRSTDLIVCSDAIRTCWQSQDKSDNGGDLDKALIHRVGNKFKHASTLEHLSYTFYISGISRALLQELARHRMASLSVKSTRYTLGELAKEDDVLERSSCGGITFDINWDVVEKYIVMTSSKRVNEVNARQLAEVQELVRDTSKDHTNDIVKYALIEAYKTELTYTINARSLQNFIDLRTSKAALWEIRNLSNALYEALPEDHKFLFENFNQLLNVENAER